MRRHNDPGPIRPPSSHYSLALTRRIPLVALKYAVAAADHLSFQHAATVLGVSPSSVSARIKTLEIDIGVQLFERRHRGVRLTAAGRQFIDEIKAGILHIDRAVMTAGAVSSASLGHIAVGSYASLASGFFAELRRRYRERHPGIELVTVEGSAAETIRQVREGALDICFAIGPIDAPDCHTRSLWAEPLVLVLPSEHRLAAMGEIAWRDVAPETFIVREDGTGQQIFEHVMRRIVECDRKPRILFRSVGRDTLMQLVASGEGITLACQSSTTQPIPGVVFRPIADETELARFHAVWSPHNSSPALRKLLDLANVMSKAEHDGR